MIMILIIMMITPITQVRAIRRLDQDAQWVPASWVQWGLTSSSSPSSSLSSMSASELLILWLLPKQTKKYEDTNRSMVLNNLVNGQVSPPPHPPTLRKKSYKEHFVRYSLQCHYHSPPFSLSPQKHFSSPTAQKRSSHDPSLTRDKLKLTSMAIDQVKIRNTTELRLRSRYIARQRLHFLHPSLHQDC